MVHVTGLYKGRVGKQFTGALGATFIAAASSGAILAFAPTAVAAPDSGSEAAATAASQPAKSRASQTHDAEDAPASVPTGETSSADEELHDKVLDGDDAEDEIDADAAEEESAAAADRATVEIDTAPQEAPAEEPGEAPADVVDVVGSVVLAGNARIAEVDEPAPRADTGIALVDPPAPAKDAVFTGRPSLIASVVTLGLRLIKPVLQLFGIELNGTSARIPLFSDGIPPFFVRGGLNVTSEDVNGWKTWTLEPRKPTGKVVIGVHGGSFISTASLFHWSTYAGLARKTGATVVVPLYPLANAEGTGGTAKTVVPVMADFIAAQVAKHGAANVSVLGDSAGGSIALAATQQLVIRCANDLQCLADTLPGRMVLLSPALDASASNPNIALVDDPLLSPKSSRRNGLWWARGLETADDPTGTFNPLASPLYGSLEHLPPTTVYAGSLDLRTPDVLVLQQKAAATGADVAFRLRNGMIHDWMIFPFLPEALRDRASLASDLGL